MERRHDAVARGGVKPGHFRGRTFSKFDSKRGGRGCSRWRFTQRFDGFVEGKSRREAARVFGLSRDTIAKMCRYSAPPGYVRSKALERPKLGLLVPVIDAILESDKTAPPKQRHTAKRIFERLRLEHRFAGGYTVVKDYVRTSFSRLCDPGTKHKPRLPED